MRIALLADIHSNIFALDAVLREIGEADFFFHAGDIVGYYTFPNECIARIRKIRNFYSVLGNHGNAVLRGDTRMFNPLAASAVEWTRRNLGEEGREYLRNLPLRIEREIFGKKFLIVHGSPLNPLEEYVWPSASEEYLQMLLGEYDFLILGHTHIPMVRRIGKKFVINPGAVGQPRDGNPKASAAILEMGREKFSIKQIRVGYEIERVAEEIRREGLPEELGRRLFEGW